VIGREDEGGSGDPEMGGSETPGSPADYALFGAAGTFGTKTRSFCIITMQA
jgi:hypothetical protein